MSSRSATRITDYGTLKIYIDEAENPEMDTEIFLDALVFSLSASGLPEHMG